MEPVAGAVVGGREARRVVLGLGMHKESYLEVEGDVHGSRMPPWIEEVGRNRSAAIHAVVLYATASRPELGYKSGFLGFAKTQK